MSEEFDAIGSGIEEFGEMDGPSIPEHFYFHIPFCRSKCAYCDFASYSGCDTQTVFAVFSAMEAEVRRWSLSALPGVIESVYVGGGTPSLHPAPVGQLLENVAAELPLRRDAEITVEANPDSLTPAALEALVEGGANRISVGVQAFDDSVLRLLGRPHTARQARQALELVADARLRLSADLICGVPGQSMASWVESLEEVLDSGARHVSVYPLTIEDGTPLAAAISGGLVAEPDPDMAAEMMIVAETRLAASGILRYEVANYAAPGFESRHNTAYWTGKSYAGIGPAAHGMIDATTARTIGLYFGEESREEVARVRYGNPVDIEQWLMGYPAEIEVLSAPSARREDAMLGLRLRAGITDQLAQSAGVEGALAQLNAEGLVEHVAGRWRTTDRGWLLGNEVFRRVWEGDDPR